jgi:hypothetical protein
MRRRVPSIILATVATGSLVALVREPVIRFGARFLFCGRDRIGA